MATRLRPVLSGPNGESWTTDPEKFRQFRESLRSEAPAIYVLWIADHVNLLSLAYISEDLRRIAREFRFFADDSLGGLVMRGALSDIDAEVLPISQKDPADRLRLLRRFMQERPSAFLAVDGGGPYFRVGTGLPNLARALKARVVPCSVVSKPRLRLSNGSAAVALPLPGATVLAAFGDPVSFSGPGDKPTAATMANDIEQALGKVGNRAIAELGSLR